MAQSGHVGRRNECVLLGVKIQQTALVKSIHHRRIVAPGTLRLLVLGRSGGRFFAFNLFAFNYLPRPHLYWFVLSLAGLGWIPFRIYQRFDSSRPF